MAIRMINIERDALERTSGVVVGSGGGADEEHEYPLLILPTPQELLATSSNKTTINLSNITLVENINYLINQTL